MARIFTATYCVYLAMYIIAPDVSPFWRATATVLICCGALALDRKEAS